MQSQKDSIFIGPPTLPFFRLGLGMICSCLLEFNRTDYSMHCLPQLRTAGVALRRRVVKLNRSMRLARSRRRALLLDVFPKQGDPNLPNFGKPSTLYITPYIPLQRYLNPKPPNPPTRPGPLLNLQPAAPNPKP